jgi:MoaA/NifB/PqqE/SkfB family radical SAM enzyme
MSVSAALPSDYWNEPGSILTFIVPALGGCDLACPYCYIRQRGEDRAAAVLRPLDYARFIREAAAGGALAAVCVQGFEPLLPSAMPYTKAIFWAGRRLGVPCSLVTNGTHLVERVEALRLLRPARIAVSLDAASAEAHDRQRGREGAFLRTVEGLKAAACGLDSATELGVVSVLLPKRAAQLLAMPALLRKLGVRRWTVSALIKVGDDAPGGPVGERARTLADLERLRAAADQAGISFAVDDEFDRLGAEGAIPEKLRLHRLIRPEGVYRLAPDGRCSKGEALLETLPADGPAWRPGIDTAAFLKSLG